MKNETPEQFAEAMNFANQSIPLSPTSEPNTCGNEYAALTGSPYAPRFKEQAYVAEINQLLVRVAELEIQNLGLSEQAIKDRREAGELRARVAELEAGLEGCAEHLELALSRLGCPTEGNDGGSHGHDADDMGGIHALETARDLLNRK